MIRVLPLTRVLFAFLSITLLLCGGLPLAAQDATPTPSAEASVEEPANGTVVVGSKEFTEQLLLGKMIILLLRQAGIAVEDSTGIGGSPVVRAALENGEIDLYPEYTGTAVSLHHGLPADALPSDADRLFALAKSLDAEKGLVWLERAPLNNTYTLMVRQDLVDQGIRSLSDLARFMNENDAPFKVCIETEFYGREQDGLAGLQARYGFAFKEENILIMDLNEAYTSLRDGACEVAEGYATDGRISAWGFTNLEDTDSFFPIYNPAPVVRTEVLEQYPEIEGIINSLMAYLDNSTMATLNGRVDLGSDGVFGSGDEESVDDVALSFLQNVRLIKPPAIAVGSKEFTEQLLLGKMYLLLLQDAGYEVEDSTGIGGSPVVRAALENGEIDLYPEYTGTGLSLHNGLPGSALPTDADRAWQLAKSLDERKGLVWLERAPLNNTYTLMVRQDLVDQGIRSLSDLARFMNENDAPFKVCIETEFYGREQDGLAGLQTHYGFAFKEENILIMDLNEAYTSLRDGACEVAEGYATDGRISAWGFTNLEDTDSFFPIYNPAPVVRTEVLERAPEIADLLNKINNLLDNESMAQLNARVDLGADGVSASGDEETVDNVAFSFLRSNRLLKPPKLTLASTAAIEQQLLSEMTALLLQDAGYEVINNRGLTAPAAVHQALENAEVDVYVEMTGIALTMHHGLPAEALPTDPERAYALAKTLDARQGLTWLNPGAYNASLALIVREDLWNEDVQSLEGLAQYMNENDAPLTLCAEAAFLEDPLSGLASVEEQYNFAFKQENVLLMDLTAAYEALRNGDCAVAAGYSTDSRNSAWGFFVLADTQALFPASQPAPVIRQEVLAANPEISTILGSYLGLLDASTMSQLKARVEIGADGVLASGDEETPAAVARDFLANTAQLTSDTAELEPTDTATDSGNAETNEAETPAPQVAPDLAPVEGITTTEEVTTTELVTDSAVITESAEVTTTSALPPSPAPTTIIVGSADNPTEVLLGQMLVLLIEDAGLPVVDRTALGSPPTVRSALEAGEVNLAPELTGRALAVWHSLPASALPADAGRSLALAQSLDQPKGLTWLDRGFFDQGLGLIAPQTLADAGLQTVADLAAQINGGTADFKLCSDPAFVADGLAALETRYAFQFNPEQIITMPADEAFASVRDGVCEVAVGEVTDGRVAAWSLTPLRDPLGFFRQDPMTVVMRQGLDEQFPALIELLEQLADSLRTADLSRLNAYVTLGADGEPATSDEPGPQAIAAGFLCQNQLIEGCNATIVNVDSLLSFTVPITLPAFPLFPGYTLTSAPTTTAVLTETVDPLPAAADITETDTAAQDEIDNARPVESTLEVLVSTPASNGVNARRAPSTQADILTLLPAATDVSAIGRTPDSAWLRVRLPDGQLAWVFTTAVLSDPTAVANLPIEQE